jgi:hypothetical protein
LARTKSTVAIYGILARASSTAVLFRRGPSRHVLLLRWNTETDAFAEGQWFKGRIYERRCDLSPDGELLIYFAAKYREPCFSWTAVCRPPFLSALALWPKGNGWGGGGLLPARDHILLNHRPDEMALASGFSVPTWVRVEPFGPVPGWGEDDPVWSTRLEREGWVFVREGSRAVNSDRSPVWLEFKPPMLWEKTHPLRPGHYTLQMTIEGLLERHGPWYLTSHSVLDHHGSTFVQLGRTTWADWSHTGDLLFTAGSGVYRLRYGPTTLSPIPTLVADFEDRVFQQRPPPEEWVRWPEE